jgi:tetratricopeptide (TPR) repeat protein
MAVFTGGCTLEAVEALCHAMADLSISALDSVAALIDRSLLRQDQTDDAEPRFLMLETIREFALEALQASGEWEKVRRAHADYFMALAEKARPELTGAQLKFWLSKLEREHDNFRAIFKWVEETGAAEDGLRLGSVIWRFWIVRGYLLEGREQLTALLALPGAAQRTALRASVLNALAIITFQLSDYSGARPFLYESLEIARELGDKRNIGLAINNLSWTGSILGEYKVSQDLAEESLALYRELNDQRGISVAFNNLGWATAFRGDLNLAQEFLEKSLRLRQEIADERGIGFAMMNLGWVEGMLGRFEKANALMEEALPRLEALGDKQLIAFVKSWGGYMFVHQGNFTRARNLLEESVLIMKEIGSKLGLGLSSYSLGVIAHAQGDANLAGELLERGVTLFRESGFKWGVVRALCSLGHLALDGHDAARALICYQESLQQSQESNDRVGLANALVGFGRLSLAAGKPDRATRLFAAAETLRTATGAIMPVFQRSCFDRDLAAARAGLGEEAFAAEYEAGKKIPVEEAAEYALENVEVFSK